MADQKTPVENKAVLTDKLGLDVAQLVDLYRDAVKVKDESFASRIAAEALTSESTAVQTQAAESISTIAAEAIGRLAALERKG